jgi:hypothetical protein
VAHPRWLAGQKFEHPAQQIVLRMPSIAEAAARLRRLDEQRIAIVPSWSWRRWLPPIRRCVASPSSLR